jgi:hypothetical protein
MSGLNSSSIGNSNKVDINLHKEDFKEHNLIWT